MKRTACSLVVALSLFLSLIPASRSSADALTFDQRVAAQRTIDRLMYEKRIWPAGNRAPKPAFEIAVASKDSQAKVERYLLESELLAGEFGRSIDGVQLQKEIDRLIRASRDRETLKKMFAAVNDDPFLIAECIARPLLADRLLRSCHAASPDRLQAFDTWLSWRKPSGGPLDVPDDYGYTVDWQQNKLAFGLPDKWFPLWYMPQERADHTAVWTGAEMIIWGGRNAGMTFGDGGRYDPATDTWTPVASAGSPAPRFAHTAVWTGSQMIVWGGWGEQDLLGDGARYNPSTDTWTPVSTTDAPLPRTRHTAVWTGNQMIVWGGWNLGNQNTGGRYNPSTDTWLPTGVDNVPEGRIVHTAVWTGSTMIVWGGLDSNGQALITGGIYNPVTDAWSATDTVQAPDPRIYHTALWTGQEMIIWGGETTGQAHPATAGKMYYPYTDTWLPMSDAGSPQSRYYHSAVWTGQEMILWGGRDPETGEYPLSGGRYVPFLNTWRPMQLPNIDGRTEHTAVWTGSEMIAWGGDRFDDLGQNDYLDSGSRYNPSLDDAGVQAWSATHPADATTSLYQSAVWTGAEMILWGGIRQDNQPSDCGSVFEPAFNAWHLLCNAKDVISARAYHTAVWTGDRMLVFGGAADPSFQLGLDSGASYDPIADQWTALPTTAPEAHCRHTAVWTGAEMIIWGGLGADGNPVQAGARFDPVTGQWQGISGSGAPAAGDGRTALWTGSSMIAWGSGGGAGYDPLLDFWTPLPTGNQPQPSNGHTAVWTGSEMLIWGGASGPSFPLQGGAYLPSAETWSLMSTTDGPTSGRKEHTAVWTGNEMLLWGGGQYAYPAPAEAAGFRYDRAMDTWTAMPIAPIQPRMNHVGIWTGQEMIIWGGGIGSGGMFVPNTDPIASGQLVTSQGNDNLFALGLGETLSMDAASSSDGSNPHTTKPFHDRNDSIVAFEWEVNPVPEFDCQTADAAGFDYFGPLAEGITEQDLASLGLATPGIHPIVVRVTDVAGRRSCASMALQVIDLQPPKVSVVAANGGESWPYSQDADNRSFNLIVWSAQEAFDIAATKISYTTDGQHWTCIADSSGADCPSHDLAPAATSFDWEMPTQAEAAAAGQTFPSATARLRVAVWDDSGNWSSDDSDWNFYIIQPSTTLTRTLILWNQARIESAFPGTAQSLQSSLAQLAEHAKVSGFVRDLSAVPAVAAAYGQWDANLTDPQAANSVAAAIREYIAGQAGAYPNLQYLILVGDDYQIPFYRMADGVSFYPESVYPTEPGIGLDTVTTVGSAIAAGLFLSDNYYGSFAPQPTGLPSPHDTAYLDGLYPGRLVETPAQMVELINTFLAQNGQINVTGPSDSVLVAGHDFLYDSAVAIKDEYAASHPTDCLLDDPDAQLSIPCLDAPYGPEDLQAQLLSSPVHRIASINTHANHFTWQTSSGSLSTETLRGAQGLLKPSVIYTSGCHSGLPVPPGSGNTLDWPELMSGKGVVAFIGNTGYGWGLLHGVGLTERLMKNITDEIVQTSPMIAIGKALAEAKTNYYLSDVRYDVFDEKVLHESTLFGIPNYQVVTSIDGSRRSPGSPPPPAEPSSACRSGVCVTKKLSASSLVPPGVTELNLYFLFGSQTYTTVHTPDGDFFQLNGGTSGEVGQVIQPEFVYNSALSGTTAHGVVFTGGNYAVITPFDPVVGVPSSTNENEGEGPLPGRRVLIPVMTVFSAPESVAPSFQPVARASAPASSRRVPRPGYTGAGEPTNLVAETAYYDPDTAVERRFDDMQFVAYYSNSADRQGPVLEDPGDAGFHTRDGNLVHFSVPVSDPDGVFRVIATFNDTAAGRWKSQDLAYDEAAGSWEGDITITGETFYFIQAIDNNGNVGVLLDSGLDTDPSGDPYGSSWYGPRIFEIQVDTTSSIFYDDFEDGDADGWSVAPAWSVQSGQLTALTARKTSARSPAFPPCSDCSFEAEIRVERIGERATLFAWYADAANNVQLSVMPDRGKIQIRQKAAGVVVARKNVPFTFQAGASPIFTVTYSNGQLAVRQDGAVILTRPTPVAPVGGQLILRVRSMDGQPATGQFDFVRVY